MDIIELIPHVGCSTIKFGMTKTEVECLLGPGSYNPGATYPPGKAPEIYPTIEGFYQPYPNLVSPLYRIGYIEDKVAEISVFSLEDGLDMEVRLFGVELFKNKAEQVIAELESYEECVWDTKDKELSYTYTFDKIAFSLWRESAFHPKLYENAAYMEDFEKMPTENQMEELKFQYFQVATMQTPELHASMKKWMDSLNL